MNLKSIAATKALDWIKPRRKKFYREIYKRWADRDIKIRSLNANWHDHKILLNNPDLMAELYIIGQALFAIGFKTPENGIGWNDYAIIHICHMDKFKKLRLIPMANKHGGYFPHMDKTKAIQEFIARGFIHEDNLGMDFDPNDYWVKATIAPLIWPEGFEHQQEAADIQGKYGIPGYTKIILPKHKKTL